MSEGRGLIGLVIIVLLAVLVGGAVAWMAAGAGPDISQPPPGVPVVKLDGFALAVNELKFGDMPQISVTLDIPVGRFVAPWHTLESDPESRLWIRYGGQDHPARFYVIPARMPEGSPILRVWLTGFFNPAAPPPQKGEPIEAGLTVPGAAVRRSTPLTFHVKGVEQVARIQ
jgi:hypothetical protein